MNISGTNPGSAVAAGRIPGQAAAHVFGVDKAKCDELFEEIGSSATSITNAIATVADMIDDINTALEPETDFDNLEDAVDALLDALSA